MKANYEEDKVIVSATEPTGVNRKKVWFKNGKNLFNKTNYIIDSAGKIGFVLDLEKGETYTISSNLPLYVAKFANFSVTAGNGVGPEHCREFIQWTFIAGDNIANVLNNTLFLGTSVNTISTNISDFDNYNIQIEKGSVATAYEAHVEPEIYILNNNNVYERVYSKSELNKEHYSTGEQKIGTWIDGKNLYRKTIFKTAKITANTNLVINSEIQNIDTITKIDGVISSSLKNNYRQINTYNLENNAVSISMSASTNGNITIYSTDDWSTPNIIITLEYTKTTD